MFIIKSNLLSRQCIKLSILESYQSRMYLFAVYDKPHIDNYAGVYMYLFTYMLPSLLLIVLLVFLSLLFILFCFSCYILLKPPSSAFNYIFCLFI